MRISCALDDMAGSASSSALSPPWRSMKMRSKGMRSKETHWTKMVLVPRVNIMNCKLCQVIDKLWLLLHAVFFIRDKGQL